jgi:predicted transcriptional regulator
MEALEFLGAGFYAFGSRNKAILYGRSREKVGGMLSLAYFYQHEQNKTAQDILKIEEELMPAFSSLIRKIEKKNERA